MAGPVPTLYVADNGANYYYNMHAYLLQAQGVAPPGPAIPPGTGKWPYKRSWMRHIGILMPGNRRDEIPIMSISNGLYVNGGNGSITINGTAVNFAATGRRGEKIHFSHTIPT